MRPAGARNVTWTAEEDQELRRIYSLGSAGAATRALGILATQKGITRELVRKRAGVLGVARVSGAHRPWTQAEDENLAAYAGRMSTRKISRILARSEDSVRQRIWLLKLSARVKERKGYRREELADLLGVDEQKTLGSILSRMPLEMNELRLYSVSTVQLWLWTNLESLELRRMNQPWLKQMLKEAI